MKKSAPTSTAAQPSVMSRNRREPSPMATMPVNTSSTNPSAKQTTRSLMRSPSGSPLPNIQLDEATVALIKENEQMLQTITVLQHEVDKQKVRLSDAEQSRAKLQAEVEELRSALGLATSAASSTSGKILNYKTAYTELQAAYDQLKKDAEATKNKLDEATRREHSWMQSASTTARQQGRQQQQESLDVVLRAMNLPDTFLKSIQAIVKKLKDPAVRPADRRQKVQADIQRLEAKVANYKPAEKSAATTAEGVPQVDVPIRQCVYGYLVVILQLLTEDTQS